VCAPIYFSSTFNFRRWAVARRRWDDRYRPYIIRYVLYTIRPMRSVFNVLETYSIVYYNGQNFVRVNPMNNKTINPSGTFMFDVVVLRRVTQGPPKSSVCYVYYHYEYFFLPLVKPNGFTLYCSVIKNYLDFRHTYFILLSTQPSYFMK